jgi:multiple sugar transport system ATP-binding protein
VSALTVRDVSKRFGPTEVLKGIRLEIGSGEFTMLVGPSVTETGNSASDAVPC